MRAGSGATGQVRPVVKDNGAGVIAGSDCDTAEQPRMGIQYRLHRLVDMAATAPGIRSIGKQLYERRFVRAVDDNLHRGVYLTFEQARASAPPSKPLGYDNEESARLYLNRMSPIAGDYPAMFWIHRSIAAGIRSIVDLGGSIGIKYYAFSKGAPFPSDLRWTVVDVDAAVKAGQRLALGRDSSRQLRFETTLEAVGPTDLLFASGSLQYMPDRLPTLLRKLPKMPRRVLVNTTPVHPRLTFYTVNNIGTAFCPYRIESRSELVDGLLELGYSITDEWQDPGRRLAIPFYPEFNLDFYSGFCFDLS